VHRILPAFTDHGVVSLDGERAARRAEHWRRVAISACEQCGRNVVPEVAVPRPLEALWPELETLTVVILDPGGSHRLDDLPAAGAFALVVGPEGGLSEREHAMAVERGGLRLALGPRILRTETAAIAALTALQLARGDLGSP
jgi:16S rRNA (uracil1498-N3)-methyltransferase